MNLLWHDMFCSPARGQERNNFFQCQQTWSKKLAALHIFKKHTTEMPTWYKQYVSQQVVCAKPRQFEKTPRQGDSTFCWAWLRCHGPKPRITTSCLTTYQHEETQDDPMAQWPNLWQSMNLISFVYLTMRWCHKWSVLYLNVSKYWENCDKNFCPRQRQCGRSCMHVLQRSPKAPENSW